MHPAKTPISLSIHPVWSESSLFAWRKVGSLATHWAHGEESDQVFAGGTCYFVGFVMLQLFWDLLLECNKYLSHLMTKPKKWSVCPAKTQISLGIRWAKDPSFLHADSEDTDQTGWMPRLIWVFAGHTCHFVGFVMRRLILSITWHASYKLRLLKCNYYKIVTALYDCDCNLAPGKIFGSLCCDFGVLFLLLVSVLMWYRISKTFQECVNWADSRDYGTFCPPWTHPSNAHAQPSSMARCLIFGPDLSSILHVCEQRRLWRDCAKAQARQSPC